MHDANVSDDLRQLLLGQVKALEYGRYDINGHHFWMTKLEASCPLAATINSGVVANGEDVSGLAADYVAEEKYWGRTSLLGRLATYAR
jgi:hypothetical protein